MLISTKELEKNLQGKNLVLIDTRSFQKYSEGHIPGAVNLDLYAFHWVDTSQKGIQAFNEHTKNLFSFAGISNERRVIFYDDVSGMLASRGVWLSMYFSHKDSLMLDGGFNKWKNEGLPTELKSNGFKATEFLGKTNPDLIAGFEYIRDNINRLAIIDARSPDEFSGKVIRATRKGHIPNSVNIDWKENLEDDGTLKQPDELSKLYSIPKDKEIITYCQGAYRAANSFLALKRLGYENVKVYLGSWGEWGNRLDLPAQ